MVRLADPVAPPYVVPTMDDVRAVEPNGYNVVSTFSGCGGSCLGFRLAGFTIRFASEFVPEAANTYAANNPGTPLDRRDVRELSPDDVRALSGLGDDELDVLEGSPPCASFSVSGIGSKGWGQVKKYSDVEQRTDDLFFEFVRLRDGLRPKVFVAENVAGLVRGVAKGYFKEIYAALSIGYRVESRVVDAQWLGVPQMRRRLIFIGVRDDLDVAPSFPKPFAYRYALRDAISSSSESLLYDPETGERISLDGYAIARAYDRLRPGEGGDGTRDNRSSKYLNLIRSAFERPAPTITATLRPGTASAVHPSDRRHFTLDEYRAIASFPPDFALTGTYAQRAERIGRAVPPLMMRAIAESVRDEILAVIA